MSLPRGAMSRSEVCAIILSYTVKVGVLNPNTLENTFLLHFENTC